DDEVGPERQRQGPPARARRSDDRAHRQVLEGRPRPAHEDVTRILAFGERRQREPRRQFGGEILEAVDRAVDQPFAQRLLDLPHEQALAPDGGQTGVDPPVALGPDRDDLDVDPERPQTCGHRSGLYQRERASPRPELHWTECLGAGIRRGWRAVGTAWLRAANAHCIIVTRLTITSSRSRSETIVGITSTSPWRARNFATSRSTSTSARCASRRRSRRFASTTCFRSSMS